MKTELSKRAGSTTTAQKVVYQSDVTPATDGNYITTTNDVKANLAALDNAIHTNSAVIVEKLTTAESGYAATYIVKQGGSQVGASINIPKDYLVKNAELKTVETEDTPYTGAEVRDKYIDFTVNTTDASGTAQHIYLPVKDLVDVYTSGSAAGDMVVVSINGNNKITATLDSGVQASLEKADSAVQSVTLASGTNNGTVKLTVDDMVTDNIAVTGLGSAAYTESTAYATSAQGAKADRAVQGVKLAGADAVITLDSNKVAVIPNAVATGTGETNGLMTAADKAKLDGFDDASKYKTKQDPITDSGTGYVSAVIQNADGVISVTKTALPTQVKPDWNAAADTAAEILNKPVMDGTYNAETNKVATQSTVTDAIAALDVTEVSVGASKTVDKISETDGKISVTATPIQIAESQVTDLTTHLATKADKVTGATADHIATFVTGGGIQDSGKVVGDFATAAQGSKADSAIQSVSGDSGVTVSTSNNAVTVAAKVDGSTVEIDSSSKNIQVKDGGITTAKLANLASFKLVDTANDGTAFQGRVYQITIDHGVLTVTPVAS